jgi:3-oxoacyl-(acyl-carrier-protein) synthase
VKKRAVITGVGCVSAAGIYPGPMWSNVLEGVSGIGPITRFDSSSFPNHVAGEVRADPADLVPKRVLMQTDRHTHHGLVAANLALTDAGVDVAQMDPGRIGLALANSLGGSTFGEEQLAKLYTRGARHVSAYMAIALFYAATVGQVSIRHNLKGYAKTPVADRAGAIVALGDALDVVGDGALDICLGGGCEAPVSPLAMTACLDTGLVAPGDGQVGYAPFNGGVGYVIGEGGAVLVIEEREHALDRGVPIYAELAGFGHTFDAHHPIDPNPDGVQYARAMRLALESAGIEPGDVGQVWVEGLGSSGQDARELRALRAVFGESLDGIQLLCTKPLYGHTLAAAGGLEAAMASVAQRERSLPPVTFPTDGLPFVIGTGLAPRGHTLVIGTGRGGINAAIVLSPHDDRPRIARDKPAPQPAGVEAQVLVNASVAEAFDYVARISTWPIWQPALDHATASPAGRLALGSDLVDSRRHYGLPIESTFKVAGFEEGSLIRLESAGGRMSIEIRFAPLDTGAKVRVVVEIEPSALPPVGALELARVLNRELQVLLASLKDTLESHGDLDEALERWLPRGPEQDV